MYKRTAIYCLSVPLFIHFSFSPMKISVADLSAPIGASVFKLNEVYRGYIVFAFSEIMFVCLSVNFFFRQRFLSKYLG